MSRVILVSPWVYHDVGKADYDFEHEWRNGPYNIVLLATILNKAGHTAKVIDLQRDLIMCKGNLDACLSRYCAEINDFHPDIIGFSFFSIHHYEIKQLVSLTRETCEKNQQTPMLIGGGIHATIEPEDTITNLGLDYAFVGEGDIALTQLADGVIPETIPGVVGRGMTAPDCSSGRGAQIENLDDLPFPDWTLCDYEFYSSPSYARLKVAKTRILDISSSRGCWYKCGFCAYNALSAVRFYSGEYLANHMEQMHRDYGVDSVYFTDSTIGNNRKILVSLCEHILKKGLQKKVKWLANIRPNQVTEEILRLMQRAGCVYLFYGFETNSQRILDAMDKGCRVEHNEKAARLQRKLGFIYNASFIIGYPGEREEDIQASLDFIRRHKPPSVGINCYVPLPGSPDYDRLKADGVIQTDDPEEWRRVGEVNVKRHYCDIEKSRFDELLREAQHLAYSEIPAENQRTGFWNLSDNIAHADRDLQEARVSLNRVLNS